MPPLDSKGLRGDEPIPESETRLPIQTSRATNKQNIEQHVVSFNDGVGGSPREYVPANVARQLERELAEALQRALKQEGLRYEEAQRADNAELRLLSSTAGVPLGYKLVPTHPTQEMIRAAYGEQPSAINWSAAQAYRDMLMAFPTEEGVPLSARTGMSASDCKGSWRTDHGDTWRCSCGAESMTDCPISKL